MLDIKYIRDNAEAVKQNADLRLMPVDVGKLLELDEHIKAERQQIDLIRAERNKNAETLKNIQDKKSSQAQELIQLGKKLKENISHAEQSLEDAQKDFTELMLALPNLTHPDAPIGKTDEDNVEVYRSAEPTSFDFEPKDHIALAEQHDLYDFETAANVTGSGFYYTKNEAALLEQALMMYAVDVCRSKGYTVMNTPDLARQDVLQGTGFNPRGDETQIYNIENTDLSLIATAEITVGGYYKDHTFQAGELDEPKKIIALSHCFRTEAGAYGRESRGMYRVHQFMKAEMFIFCRPDQSEAMHEELRSIEQEIAAGLGFPYRVVDICTGDLGGPAYKKYDLEAWMPFRNGWGEITSTSNCTDFQARRLNTKFTDEDGNKQFVHTLNGTATVSSRMPIAILENNQNADGSIDIPTALHPYMLGVTKIG